MTNQRSHLSGHDYEDWNDYIEQSASKTEIINSEALVSESFAEWVVTSRIPHKHVNGLLQIINEYVVQ